MSTLTLDMLEDMRRKVREVYDVGPLPGEPRYPSAVEHMAKMNALRIMFSHRCLEATPERLFPVSKNRSKRILKKLIKRHGGEYRMRPCMFRSGNLIIAHPVYEAQLRSAGLQ